MGATINPHNTTRPEDLEQARRELGQEAERPEPAPPAATAAELNAAWNATVTLAQKLGAVVMPLPSAEWQNQIGIVQSVLQKAHQHAAATEPKK